MIDPDSDIKVKNPVTTEIGGHGVENEDDGLPVCIYTIVQRRRSFLNGLPRLITARETT